VNAADRQAGKSYNSNFATRMKGDGIWADMLSQRFRKTCERLGLNKLRNELDLRQFDPSQLSSQRGLF
jgi:hypothetical protein